MKKLSSSLPVLALVCTLGISLLPAVSGVQAAATQNQQGKQNAQAKKPTGRPTGQQVKTNQQLQAKKQQADKKYQMIQSKTQNRINKLNDCGANTVQLQSMFQKALSAQRQYSQELQRYLQNKDSVTPGEKQAMKKSANQFKEQFQQSNKEMFQEMRQLMLSNKEQCMQGEGSAMGAGQGNQGNNQ